MLIGTTWKARPLSREQTSRMMTVWGKIEADMAANPGIERLCWYITADASAGVTVVRAVDADAATAYGLEIAIALGEFLEIDSRPVLDLESAMPAILAGIERTTA
ncbi:MAG TPA: hypothetical protein VM282_16595 [Acidimicrobiales bacterium]|nr:hypothetical protein [Acidimicrobiales bacterium]